MTYGKALIEGPYIIAEVGLTHEGSLGNALKFIDIFSELGASAIKFQMHIPEHESSADDSFREATLFPQDSSRIEYYSRTSFDLNEWKVLRKHCRQKKIDFGMSIFSEEALYKTVKLNPDFLKVGSGESLDIFFINKVLSTKYPVIISTGLNTEQERAVIIDIAAQNRGRVSVLHCSSLYPVTPEYWRLNDLQLNIKKNPGINFGISDHSGKLSPSIIAANYGARIFEVHVTISNMSFGPDVSSSHDPISFALLVSEIKQVFQSKLSPDTKYSEKVRKIRSLFSKSLYYKDNLKAGKILNEKDLCYLKPGVYIPSTLREKYIGRTLRVNVCSHTPLKITDFADENINIHS